MDDTSFSGADLEDALQDGSLSRAQTRLTGMVKASEESDHVSFSQDNCETWVDLPTDMIERADHVGHRPCRDHSHPVMRITLTEPENSDAKALFGLLSQAATSQAEAQQGEIPGTYPPPETGVSFRSFGQNAPPQPWLNDGGGMFDGGFGFGTTRCIRWSCCKEYDWSPLLGFYCARYGTCKLCGWSPF